MATYPIKMLNDENNNAFIPLTSSAAVMDENGLSIDHLMNEGKYKIQNNLTTEEAGIGILDASQGKILSDSINTKQSILTAGNNIIIDENNVISALGGIEKDNLTINENVDGKIQAIGIIDVNTGNVDRFWTGTLAEYNAIETKDTGTIYYITDEEDTPATQEYVNNAIQEALGTIESELGGI